MTVLEVLTQAKALLTPEVWVPCKPVAPQLCALTAIDRAANWQGDHWVKAAMRLKKVLNVSSIAVWNDSHTYPEVMAGFDKAIALAREQEGHP